jgi:competence protein ComEC
MQFLRRNFPYLAILALTLVSIGIWAEVFASTPPGKLTFAVLNIGQGDSLFIESPTGVQILIDGGPGTSALLRELPKVMSLGDREIDAVIETHPDADHMGGFVDLLKRYKVDNFISPGIEKHNATTDALMREVAEQNVPNYVARRGMWLDLGGGARLTILFPDTDVSHMNPDKDNDGGVVSHLVFGSTTVLLTADVTKAVEEHLIQISSSTDLESTILKVGHHGSRFSTGADFVKIVHPMLAVISVGAKNPYGHPTQEALNVLGNQKIPILRTDRDGTLIFKSNGVSFERVK